MDAARALDEALAVNPHVVPFLVHYEHFLEAVELVDEIESAAPGR